jgi:hypothetical protein
VKTSNRTLYNIVITLVPDTSVARGGAVRCGAVYSFCVSEPGTAGAISFIVTADVIPSVMSRKYFPLGIVAKEF